LTKINAACPYREDVLSDGERAAHDAGLVRQRSVRDWFDKDPVREFSLRDETTVALNLLGSYELIHVASVHQNRSSLAWRGCAQKRLKEVKAQEENQRRWTTYEKLKAERDKLVTELRATYPTVETRLGELIAKIERNDREIEFVNAHTLPTGAERLRSAELIARGIEAWRVNQTDVVRITMELCLPAFIHNPHRPFAWRHPERQI
jgi:hypothetical protein